MFTWSPGDRRAGTFLCFSEKIDCIYRRHSSNRAVLLVRKRSGAGRRIAKGEKGSLHLWSVGDRKNGGGRKRGFSFRVKGEKGAFAF